MRFLFGEVSSSSGCLGWTTLFYCGNGSFRPRVVSALSRFGPGSFRPGSFRPGSIRPWVVSAQFGGSFRPIFSQLSGLLPKFN